MKISQLASKTLGLNWNTHAILVRRVPSGSPSSQDPETWWEAVVVLRNDPTSEIVSFHGELSTVYRQAASAISFTG